MKQLTITLLLLTVLLSSQVQTKLLQADISVEITDNQATIITDSLTVNITGGENVPKFNFWETDQSENVYKLQFSGIFEIEDNLENGTLGAYDQTEDKKLGGTIEALSPFRWDFSDFTLEEENSELIGLHFNITSTDGPSDIDWKIQFRNHLYIETDFQLKFDVLIDNYEFQHAEGFLVLAFKIGSNDPVIQNGNEIVFGNGFFNIENTAEANGETIPVGLSIGDEDADPKIYLTYGHFSGNLLHDPTLGIRTSRVSNPTNPVSISGSDDQITTTNDQGNPDFTSNAPDGMIDDLLSSQNSPVLGSLSPEVQISSTLIATIAFLLIPSLLLRLRRK